MGFDPAQDPWGAALVVTAALSGLGLLLALVARGLSRSASVGGWLMGLGLVGFLGSAVAGAVVRVESGIASAAAAERDVEAEVESKEADEDDEKEQAVDEGDAPTDEGDEDEGDEDAPEPNAEANGAAEKAGASPTVAVAKPGALPSDPAELRAAVRVILRDTKQVADGKNSCKDPQQLADAWAKLSSIPDEAWTAKANIVARKLDSCRRTLAWTTLYVVRHEQIKARADFVSVMDKRLQDAGKGAAVSVHERNHTRIRIGTQSISHDEFATMLDGGLRKELESLGFDRVTFSDGSQAITTDLEPIPDQQLANERLEPYGLLTRFTR